MNGAPDWQDGECCFRCRTQFTLVARKHHCRNCGNIFCAKCSSQQIPLPKLNIDKNVRVCDTCYEKITNKSVDPLDLALDSKDKEQTKIKTATTSSSSAKSASSSSTSSTNKTANNASAPSEQELKEEEELQLALALSLSETPTKVSFPDYRQLAEPVPSSSNTPAVPLQAKSATVDANIATAQQSITSNGISPQHASGQQASISKTPTTVADQYAFDPLSTLPAPIQQQAHLSQVIQPPPSVQPEYPQVQGRDLEVFKYVGEIQSTLEVFNNRLESCKLRNRPVANDAAIQSLFLKLNSEYQPKLTEYIRTYEEERAYYERLQDKLSQIEDARAALDDLRQEHQEKVRQEAAEAERQRQSQLASKLEAMRQKKSQMMQYQRELALQRIREQEMMVQQQQQPQPPATSVVTTSQVYQLPQGVAPPHYMVAGQTSFDQSQGHLHDSMHSMLQQQHHHQHQPPTTMHQEWSATQQPQQQQQQQQVPYSGYNSGQQAQSYQPAPQQSTALNHHLHQQQQPPLPPPPTTQINSHQPQQPYVPPAQAQGPAPAPQPTIDRAALAQLERQFLPNAKPEEDAPLISFDD